MPLRNLHIFHHVAQLVQQFLRLGCPPFLHQLLQLVQHRLHLVLRNLHALLVFCRLLVRVLRLLLGQLLHIVLHRLVHILHQFGDFLLVGTVPDRFRQAVLRPVQPGLGISQIAIFHQNCHFPQGRHNLVPHGRRQGGYSMQPLHRHAQQKIGPLIPDEPFRQMRQSAQNLIGPYRIVFRPQQVASHFDQRRRQRVKKPAARQYPVLDQALADLPIGILDEQGDRDRQIGQCVLRQIFYQLFGKHCPPA